MRLVSGAWGASPADRRNKKNIAKAESAKACRKAKIFILYSPRNNIATFV
jgi:hypothetical protein